MLLKRSFERGNKKNLSDLWIQWAQIRYICYCRCWCCCRFCTFFLHYLIHRKQQHHIKYNSIELINFCFFFFFFFCTVAIMLSYCLIDSVYLFMHIMPMMKVNERIYISHFLCRFTATVRKFWFFLSSFTHWFPSPVRYNAQSCSLF